MTSTSKYYQDRINGIKAWDCRGQHHPLSAFPESDVKFVGGLWRVQEKFPHTITNVRGVDFVLGEKLKPSELPGDEIKFFEYYRAMRVGQNCYGYFADEYDWKVAKCGQCWGFGHDISEARARLAVRVLDVFGNEISPVVSKEKIK